MKRPSKTLIVLLTLLAGAGLYAGRMHFSKVENKDKKTAKKVLNPTPRPPLPDDPEDLLGIIRHVVHPHTSPLTKYIGAYKRPAKEVPSLVFSIVSDPEDATHEWGDALARALQLRLTTLRRSRLLVPDTHRIHVDGLPEKKGSLAGARLAAKRRGVNSVLTGKVTVKKEKITITLELRKNAEEDSPHKIVLSGTLEKFNDTLGKAAEQTYAALEIELPETQLHILKKTQSLSGDQLRDFAAYLAEVRDLTEQRKWLAAKKLMDAGKASVPLAFIYLKGLNRVKNQEENSKRLKEMYAAYPNSRAVLLGAAFGLLKSKNKEYWNNGHTLLRRELVADPADDYLLRVYSQKISATGRSQAGTPAAIEAVARQPGNYRGWWGLSYCLRSLAWRLRGRKFNHETSEEETQQYNEVMELSRKSFKRAMKIHDSNPEMWILKIQLARGYNQPMQRAFLHAVKLDPQNRGIYKAAINYAQERWGGSMEAIEWVGGLAIKNNPDKQWPIELLKDYRAREIEFVEYKKSR